MSGSHIEIKIPVTDEELKSLLIARLEGIGYESFVEGDDQLIAYIPVPHFDEKKLEGALTLGREALSYAMHILEDKNWNEEWEKSYAPVTIAGKCHVRAPFHPELTDFPLQIVIEPRMAFGTAHHETTALMMEWEMETDLKDKEVLDMGCGSGILAILANKLGAKSVIAVDNDEWACRNAEDNFRINGATKCTVISGDISVIRDKPFDIILANINRNTLLEDIPEYARALKTDGKLFLSGFYRQDLPVISEEAGRHGFAICGQKTSKDWMAICFSKKT